VLNDFAICAPIAVFGLALPKCVRIFGRRGLSEVCRSARIRAKPYPLDTVSHDGVIAVCHRRRKRYRVCPASVRVVPCSKVIEDGKQRSVVKGLGRRRPAHHREPEGRTDCAATAVESLAATSRTY
jgi:hypothetical protein